MLEITKIIPGGQALGTHPDGRKIFFWNALPGELVTDFNITKQKSHYYFLLHPGKSSIGITKINSKMS